jgi:phenylacetate-CoA ligase
MGRLVKAIDGRKEDYLVLSDGSLVGRIDHLFKDATSVTEAQVVQRKRGEAIFRIVRAEGYATKDEDALRREVTDRFGDRLGISFEYVDALPRSSRGKLRLVVSEMDEAKVE